MVAIGEGHGTICSDASLPSLPSRSGFGSICLLVLKPIDSDLTKGTDAVFPPPSLVYLLVEKRSETPCQVEELLLKIRS